jgi:hypothetical protein
MSKIPIILCVAFLGTASVTAGLAQPKGPGGFVGTVGDVNEGAKTLTVKSGKGDVILDASNPTLEGYRDLSEVKTGDKVATQYTKEGLKIDKIGPGKKSR